MGQTEKKKKRQQCRIKNKDKEESEQPNQEILDSIGSPNVWTPKKEDLWLRELSKIPNIEIYQRFPPVKKPPNVSKRGKSSGWGDGS
jgi:hypothetical protein